MNTTLRMKIALPTSPAEDQSIDESIDEVPIKVGVPGPLREVGSTAAKDFLAMRARQKTEAARVRRWKRVGMGLFFTGMAAAALTMYRRQERALVLDVPATRMLAPPVRSQLAPLVRSELAPVRSEVAVRAQLAPPVQARLAVAPPASRPAPAVTAQTIASHTLSAPAALPAALAPSADSPVAQCKLDFARHQWRALIASCTKAFAVAPGGTVALRIAHGHWATGDAAQAGVWATKAVALGSQDADAYVLIGHAERQAGHPRAAIAAYRHYLREAPSGWHAHNLRAAIRELSPAPAAPTEEPAADATNEAN